MMYVLTVVFMLMPFQPLIFRGANVTSRPVLHKVEYYVDMDKYYFPILLHGYLAIVIFITSIIAVDMIFVIFVQHACGLFILIGLVARCFPFFLLKLAWQDRLPSLHRFLTYLPEACDWNGRYNGSNARPGLPIAPLRATGRTETWCDVSAITRQL